MMLQKLLTICLIFAVVSCTQVSLNQQKISINHHHESEAHMVVLEAEDAHSTENIEILAGNAYMILSVINNSKHFR